MALPLFETTKQGLTSTNF